MLASVAAVVAGTATVAAQPVERVAPENQRRVAPGLADYTDRVLFGDVWKREALRLRDRSLVTISALIATGKTAQLTGHLGRALDNGVTPAEVSAVLTHLAFYVGWPNAVSAVAVADEAFAKRGIRVPDDPVDHGTAPAAASSNASEQDVAPKLAELTRSVLEGDLWRRTDLTARDRSLVTIAALAAAGETDALGGEINRGFAGGLTRDEITEAITHIAFYAGWPRAQSALPVLSRAFSGAGQGTR